MELEKHFTKTELKAIETLQARGFLMFGDAKIGDVFPVENGDLSPRATFRYSGRYMLVLGLRRPGGPAKPIDEMTRDEMRDELAGYGVEHTNQLNKAEAREQVIRYRRRYGIPFIGDKHESHSAEMEEPEVVEEES